MEPIVREAVASAMKRLKEFSQLDEPAFEQELEWHLRNVYINSNKRIMWHRFEIGRKLFKLIGESQGWKCSYCKINLDIGVRGKKSPFRPTFEHVIPLSKEGPDHPDNLIIVCYSCNQRRQNLDLEYFL